MTLTLDRPPADLGAMTLTLVPLNHPSLRGIKRWTDHGAIHQAVMGLFATTLPGEPAARRAGAGILYRHDVAANGEGRLLVQHAVGLQAEPAGDQPLQQANLEPLAAHLVPGLHVRFRVVLNAVRSQTLTKKRLAVTEPEDLLEWGLGRLAGAGLEQVEFSDLPATTLGTTGKSALWMAQYDGHAVLGDAALTEQALRSGVGRSKAYGCGLLSLAPLGR